MIIKNLIHHIPRPVVIFLLSFFIWPVFSYPIFAIEKIDINTASPDQLDQLEGIGAVYAQRIIDGRPYSSLDDLLRVKGIGPTTLQKIKDQGLACVNCGAVQENSNSQALPSGSSPAPTSSATPSVTPTPGYQYSQKIFINEFMPWPETGAKEWLELINFGDTAINLSGWQIDDDDNSTAPQVVPDGTSLAPGEFLVITFNKNVLNNDGDKVRLLWPDDQIVHAVAYNNAKQGQSVAKFDSGWLWTNRPTPGQANKKSFIEKSEIISPANASNNADKITAVEEAVAAQGGAPRIAVANNQKITAPTSAPPENNFTANRGAQNPNLAAAAAEPIKKASGMNPTLALTGVVVLSALAAAGLVYFKRKTAAQD